MIWPVIAWGVGGACCFVSARRYQRLLAVDDGAELASKLRLGSRAELEQLQPELPGGLRAELVAAALAAESAREVMAELNLSLGLLKHELNSAGLVAKSATRIAVAASGFCAAVALIQWLSGRGGLPTLALCIAAGVVTGAVSAWLARRAQRRAGEQLTAWGTVARRLTRFAETEWPGQL
ncbi:MAG: hypothetical protein KIT72_10350 [Polyangiaceae bacterium]|nr:hypothetical protein [Polyangiaceae bacterium]MCW5790812.1 hypothetical protein [Polyangiaceae bacterium]